MFWVALVALESDSENTITTPSVMLVIRAPSKYPSISFDGLGSSSITVVAATNVGFNEAVSDRRITWPTGANQLAERRRHHIARNG